VKSAAGRERGWSNTSFFFNFAICCACDCWTGKVETWPEIATAVTSSSSFAAGVEMSTAITASAPSSCATSIGRLFAT
jgi:hypothetical protein